MRVIAGTARGMRLAAPRGMETRPTADRVREALFSIITSRRDLQGARVLDICAGTGSLGIEALSRGAGHCCFIEHERRVLAVLKKNLETVHFSTRSEIIASDSPKALHFLASRAEQYDIIFFDPPYASTLYAVVPEIVSSGSLLVGGGLFVMECAARSVFPERAGHLVRIDRRVYGDTALEFYSVLPEE